MTVARLARSCAALVVGAALVGGAATAASAQPATVKPLSTNVIVVQKSIGGIRIGETLANARKGFPTKGCASYVCEYTGAGYTVSFTFTTPKSNAPKLVNAITIYAYGKAVTPASKVRTSAGIGIGSTGAAVHKAYPKAHGSTKSGLFIIGSGKPKTVATVISLNKGKVAQISIGVQRAN